MREAVPCRYNPAMDVHYLFDSHGSWIAFKDGDLVFDRDGQFLGWTPPINGPNDVVTAQGEYLATILPEDSSHARLYTLRGKPYCGYHGRPDVPDYPGYPGHPGTLAPTALPPGAQDVRPHSPA